jgi:hypothetical protein
MKQAGHKQDRTAHNYHCENVKSFTVKCYQHFYMPHRFYKTVVIYISGNGLSHGHEEGVC